MTASEPPGRRQRKKSSPKPTTQTPPDGYNRDKEPKKPVQSEMLPEVKPDKGSVELPDAFCRYLSLKHSEIWQIFLNYAKTKRTFSIGLARLLEILKNGDNQDQRIFNLFPLDVLAEFDIELELDGVKNEFSKSGDLILGGLKFPWRKVINEVHWNNDASVSGMVRMSDIDKMPTGKGKTEAVRVRDEIENSPIVRKAVELFSGKISGYLYKTEDE